ncbi:hypothetical protein YC2023_010117 [Brassica napus]
MNQANIKGTLSCWFRGSLLKIKKDKCEEKGIKLGYDERRQWKVWSIKTTSTTNAQKLGHHPLHSLSLLISPSITHVSINPN